MKLTKRATLFISVLLIAHPAYSIGKVTIYGLESAKNYQTKDSKDFYIQLGSFAHKNNAYALKNKIENQTKYQVNVNKNQNFHVVKVGPFNSSQDVRNEANKIGAKDIVQNPVKKPATQSKPIITTTKRPTNYHKQWPFFLTASISALDLDISKAMSVNNGAPYAAPYNQDRFTINKKTQAAFSAIAGFRHQRNHQWIPSYSFGFLIQHVYQKPITGNIIQYNLSQFTNYRYNWNISSNLFALYSKLDLAHYKKITPFANLGLGIAVNRAQNYKERAYDNVTPRISPDFGDKDNVEFAYILGFGVEYEVLNNISASLAYNFQNLGKVKSKPGASTWALESLSLGSYKANTINLGLTYYFNDEKKST